MRLVGRIVAAMLGIAAASGMYVYLTLPDVRPLRTSNPSTTAFIELRAREARAAGKSPRRYQRWVGYNRIAQSLKRAVLVAEDSAFWQHEGIDVDQIRESMEVNFERMEFARGASTITQQLAKNLYLSPSRNPFRKLRELIIARRLEAELTKQRILELYLNVIEWGDGVYGAEAAALKYFKVPASGLTAGQSALLAGAIVNPRVLTPAAPTARLRRRQQLILRRMGAATPPPILSAEVPVVKSVPSEDSALPGQTISVEPAPPAPEKPQKPGPSNGSPSEAPEQPSVPLDPSAPQPPPSPLPPALP